MAAQDGKCGAINPMIPNRQKRRRSSLEHEVMTKKLADWRVKKGLPTLQEPCNMNRRKSTVPASGKHALHHAPLSSSTRKQSYIPQAEQRNCKGGGQSKRLSLHTPNLKSTTSSTSSSRNMKCNTDYRRMSRRSVLPVAQSSGPQMPLSRLDKGHEGTKKTQTATGHTTVKLLKDVTNHLTVSPVPASSQEGGISKVAAKRSQTLFIQRRKSVRFISPMMEKEDTCLAPSPVTTCDQMMTPVTVAQSAGKIGMRERLEQWMTSRGKTPSRFRNFLGYESSLLQTGTGRRKSGTPRPHMPGRGKLSTPGGRGKSAQQGGEAVATAMQECLVMLEEGCPLDYVSSWLDRLVTKIPLLQQSSAYWVCRAKVAERQSGDQSAMECLFEAVEFGPEPMKELQETLAAYRLKLKLASEEEEEDVSQEAGLGTGRAETGALSPVRCSPDLLPQTPAACLQYGEGVMNQSDGAGDSDCGSGSPPGHDVSHLSIKYSLKETTPYFARIHGTPSQTQCLLVTPVRRSARLDNKRRSVVTIGNRPIPTPPPETCLDTVQEVANAYPTAQLILRPNRALAAEFNAAELSE